MDVSDNNKGKVIHEYKYTRVWGHMLLHKEFNGSIRNAATDFVAGMVALLVCPIITIVRRVAGNTDARVNWPLIRSGLVAPLTWIVLNAHKPLARALLLQWTAYEELKREHVCTSSPEEVQRRESEVARLLRYNARLRKTLSKQRDLKKAIIRQADKLSNAFFSNHE